MELKKENSRCKYEGRVTVYLIPYRAFYARCRGSGRLSDTNTQRYEGFIAILRYGAVFLKELPQLR